jgi:hypothetical protein
MSKNKTRDIPQNDREKALRAVYTFTRNADDVLTSLYSLAELLPICPAYGVVTDAIQEIQALRTSPVYFVAFMKEYPLDGGTMGQKVARTEKEMKEIITKYYEEMYFEEVGEFIFDWGNKTIMFRSRTGCDAEPEVEIAHIVQIDMWDGKLYKEKD